MILAAWGVGTAALGVHGFTVWRAADLAPAAVGVIALTVVAASVALFYLLGFVAKSATYMLMPRSESEESEPVRETPPLLVLYLTAGDFDAEAVDSLLRLDVPGRRRFVLHDDGQDDDARKRMHAFLEEHPCAAGWEIAVWHRHERRGGKAGAVNAVVNRVESHWQWMLLCDSDSIALQTDAVRRAASSFADSSVAVVQCRNVGVAGEAEGTFPRRLRWAIDVFDAFAAPQAQWGYVPFFGHNAFVRLADLRRLRGLTPGFFSDDLDYSARLTLAGRRIVYRRDIRFGERHPGDWGAFRRRARKWGYGCMQVVRARIRQVIRERHMPLAHRVGLLEFMGFYPAQAILFAGLLAGHLLLPLLVPAASPLPGLLWSGVAVGAALLAPTLAWALREGRMREWPILAWSCVLVYGGSLPSTVRGVLDGLSVRDRPWVPTNLPGGRAVVTADVWMQAVLGLALVAVPWAFGDPVLAFPASYLFIAAFLFAPLTSLAYRQAPAPSPIERRWSPARTLVLGALLTLAAGGAAGAEPRARTEGGRLVVDGTIFEVRGVHYSPWPPGTGPDGRPYPEPDLVARDLDQIRQLGANTVVVQGAPVWTIQAARERGLYTIYAFHIGWSDTSAAAFAREAARILAAVDSLRRCEEILAWILGNEIPSWVVDLVGEAEIERRLRGLAEAVRQRDPGRLLGHANWPPTKQLDLAFLDLACFNLYPAWPYEVTVRGFGPYLREVLVPLAGGRPVLVTEFGINSLEAGEERQAAVLGDCWREIARSPVVGGVLFGWADEWWKNFDNPIEGRGFWERAYAPDDALRHDSDPEEYYGIVRSDRTPKPAYMAMREAWAERRARRSWAPWGALAGLLVMSWLVLGLGRRERRRASTGRSAVTAGVSLLLALGQGQPLAAQASGFTHGVTLTGVSANDQFGWALAGAGDLDDDGAAEVAIGARFFMVGGDTAAGAVFIYRGGAGGTAGLLLRLDGVSAHEHFGDAVAGGRDVSGDGRPDVAVGAPRRAGPAGSAAGAVAVYRAGALAAGPWVTLFGEAKDDWFGQSVDLGDLDGDGIGEIIVGAPYNDRVASAAGAVFIYRGGGTPPTTPWLVLTGEGANHHFGWSVAYLGDFDGDGFGDIAVGARLYGSGLQSARGKVYLFRGGPGMDAIADGTWLGEARDDWFGHSVAGPGDMNGGGRGDLLVGAPYNDRGGSAAGAAYVFRGEDTAGSVPAAIYVGESANAQLGWSVGSSGDVNGDGRPDAVAGARLQATPSGNAAGRVYLFGGGGGLPVTPIATTDGEAADDWLGNAVGGGGNFFRTGRGTVLAGAPYNDAAAAASGRAYVLGMGEAVAAGAARGRSRGMILAPNPTREAAWISWADAGDEPESFELLDLRGRRVALLPGVPYGTGISAHWNGRDGDGRAAGSGLYFVRVRTRAGGSPVGGVAKLVVVR